MTSPVRVSVLVSSLVAGGAELIKQGFPETPTSNKPNARPNIKTTSSTAPWTRRRVHTIL